MIETDGPSWIRLVIALTAVLGLVGGLSFVLRYINQRGFLLPRRSIATRRLQIVESLSLDTRRRLTIVRCDGREHLLLLGAASDIVIDANLPTHQNQKTHDPQA